MRAHAEAVGDWLKLFLFLMNAMARAPPPRLMDEWPVRGIHKADDSVVHIARQTGAQVGSLVFFAEGRDLRGGDARLFAAGKPCTDRPWIGNVNPDETITLFTGIIAGVDAVYF